MKKGGYKDKDESNNSTKNANRKGQQFNQFEERKNNSVQSGRNNKQGEGVGVGGKLELNSDALYGSNIE